MKITIEPEKGENFDKKEISGVKELAVVALEGHTIGAGDKVFIHPNIITVGDEATLIGHLTAAIERLRNERNSTR